MQQNPVQILPAKRPLKSRRALLILAGVELLLGLVFILFDAASVGVIRGTNYFSPYTFFCAIGNGIWVGIFVVLGAVFGVIAFRSVSPNKCLLISHFIFCIIAAALFDPYLITFGSICEVHLSVSGIWWFRRGGQWQPPGAHGPPTTAPQPSDEAYAAFYAVLIMQGIIIVSALLHMILCIVSSALMCRNLCCTGETSVTVLYVPTQEGKDTQPVTVPAGTQVVFVPSAPHQGQKSR